MSDSRQDWHPEDIKAAIRKTGFTICGLAAKYGYSNGALHKTFVRPSPRMEQVIARHIGLLPEQIWPSRYTPNGLPLPAPKRSPKQDIRRSGAMQPQIGAAA